MKSNEVFISSFCKETLNTVLQLSTLFGLSPFLITEYGNSRVYKIRYYFSYALYSCLLGIVIPSIIIFVLIHNEASHSDTIGIIYTCPVAVGVVVGVFGLLLRKDEFLQLMRHFTTIDKLLGIKDASELKNTIWRLAITFLFVLLVIIYSYYIWFGVLPHENDALSYVYYTGVSISHIFTVILILQYHIVNETLQYRVLVLSRCLNVDNLVITNDARRNKKKQILHAIRVISDEYNGNITPNKSFSNGSSRLLLTAENMKNMLCVYEHFLDSMRLINSIYGAPILMFMTSIIVNFILSTYFAVIDMLTTAQTLLIVQEFIWSAYHLCRLIMIVEPSQKLSEEIQAVRVQICRLMMRDTDAQMEQLIETFSNKMLLAPSPFFSPCDMFNVNRSLLTSVLSNVITYLVILINLYKDSMTEQ